MKIITNLTLKNKRVLIRVDFNTPVKDGEVQNDFRIRAALPTIRHCLKKGASVVLCSHAGRPKGKVVPSMSLKPMADVLAEFLEQDVLFSDDCLSDEAVQRSSKMNAGQVHMLENLRFHDGETKADPDFAKKLAAHADVFVNDAFGTAHRAHASNVEVVKYMQEAAAGFLMMKERQYLESAVQKPESPFLLILGGAKVSGKIELIENMLDKVDDIMIGGAMAFSFLKANGHDVGSSLADAENVKLAKQVLQMAHEKRVPIHLPSDVVAAYEISNDAEWRVIGINEFEEGEMGLDIGPESCFFFSEIISRSKTILWNGPAGMFEIPAYSTGTHAIASTINDASEDGAISIIGGGDTAAAVDQTGFTDAYTHVSTGGGASLELLSGIYLPAFKILDDNE